MAQSRRVRTERAKRPRPPLDSESLERIALFYLGRYATTRSKFRSYLQRKLKERGWAGERPPATEEMIERFAALGYIDDAAFAAAKASALQRRGFGERRVAQALYAAGIADEDSAEAREEARAGALAAALRFAERKRIGPFAAVEAGPDSRRRAFAAMVRAGHPIDLVRQVIDAPPGEIPDCDTG